MTPQAVQDGERREMTGLVRLLRPVDAARYVGARPSHSPPLAGKLPSWPLGSEPPLAGVDVTALWLGHDEEARNWPSSTG